MAKQAAPSSAARVGRLRARRRANGLRAVTLWLPDVNDPNCRAQLAEQCRQLAVLTAEEEQIAETGLRALLDTPGWR
jgi:hypothetical protein